MGEETHRSITEVSGGQLQRAAICRAVLHAPRILFGDEPTGALNTRASREIMEIFDRLNREGTVIVLVTHDSKVAAHAKSVCFMNDGRIVSELRLDVSDYETKLDRVNEAMQALGI